eukprot:TRINITY_DN4226_c0_g1_i6.p1 TRINITY_DN4226_c0_g1~~TRINITY_DN4226_c0_g1_i6.p1  ORF type:complete len:634 (+),score=131.16 TRINITY_DN4226_c0_g1_i6:318-2219(+)
MHDKVQERVHVDTMMMAMKNGEPRRWIYKMRDQKDEIAMNMWAVDRKTRNRECHASNGNPDRMDVDDDPWRDAAAKAKAKGKGKEKAGGKGKEKGGDKAGGRGAKAQKGKSEGPSQPAPGMVRAWQEMAKLASGQEEAKPYEDRFREQMEKAVPAYMKQEKQPMLIQEDWAVPIRDAETITDKGGVCLAKKHQLPDILTRVGSTMRPTAVLVSQDPNEIMMGAYRHRKIWVAAKVEDQEDEIMLQRYLVQLGLGDEAAMRCEDLEMVNEERLMAKIVVKLDEDSWEIQGVSKLLISDILAQTLGNRMHFDSIIVRENKTATALVTKTKLKKIMRASGEAGIYFKMHSTEDEMGTMPAEVLWLPEGMTLEQAQETRKEVEETHMGIVKKKAEIPRYGLRFAGREDLEKAAKALNIEYKNKARFRVTGLPEEAGQLGVYSILLGAGWDVDEVIYNVGGSAIVETDKIPPSKRIAVKGETGKYIVKVQATNEKAKSLSKEQARRQGQDVEMVDANPVRQALKEAAMKEAKMKAEMQKAFKEQREEAAEQSAEERKKKEQTAEKAREGGRGTGRGPATSRDLSKPSEREEYLKAELMEAQARLQAQAEELEAASRGMKRKEELAATEEEAAASRRRG